MNWYPSKLFRFLVLCSFVVLFSTNGSIVYAQQFISRGIVLTAPFISEGEPGFLSSHSFMAEVGVGNPSEVQSQAWNGRFSLGLNIYSFTFSDHIVATLSNELTATRTNSVLFNPNTSRWEEFLGYRKRIGLHSFTLGYTHFCKHEIDNFDPPFSTSQTIDSLQKRIVIFGGITGSFFSQMMFSGNSTLQYYVKSHYNVVREDYRNTRGLEGVSLARLRGMLEVGSRLNLEASNDMLLYVKCWGNIGFVEADAKDNKFSQSELLLNGRAELGLIGKGRLNNFEVFLASEFIADDLSFGAFTRGLVPSLGIRIRNPLYF
jgi:hypothetical protein